MTKTSPENFAAQPWLQRLWQPVDAGSVVFFRIVFGVLMCIHALGFFAPGKIERFFLAPSVLFKYYGFSWLEPWSLAGMKLHFAALAVCAACIALGFCYRWAAAGFCLGYLYIFLLDEATYNNHDYLICLLAASLAIVPAHRTLAVDASRKPAKRSDTLPAWALLWLQFQIAVPYVLGGIAKLNYDWMVRGEPIGMWLRTVDGAEGSFDLDWFRAAWAGHAFAWGGMLFDLAIVPLLLWRRTRMLAFLAATAFHLSNSQMFKIGIFPWLMIGATTIFFAPDWPRRLGLFGKSKLGKAKSAKSTKTAKTKRPRGHQKTSPAELVPRPVQVRLAIALGLWMAIQLLVPFRHFLYPGNVDWTEEGHRFAWRMKLRHKEGAVHFAVVDKSTGRKTLFKDFTGVLTHRQQRHLVHDPDMIRQFSHRLQQQLAESGQDVEVRALTRIALNGRKPAPLVDPTIDLAAEPRTILSADWITPFDHKGTLPD